MKVGITLSEQEILKRISLYGPKTGYQLGKETEYSEKTCYQGVKDLVDKGLLSVSVVGKTRAGLDMKEYSLTVLGLATFLTSLQVRENLDNVFRSWPDLLPFKLEEWEFLVNTGVEELARRNLLSAAAMLVRTNQQNIFPGFKLDHPEYPRKLFRFNFYYPTDAGRLNLNDLHLMCMNLEEYRIWIKTLASSRYEDVGGMADLTRVRTRRVRKKSQNSSMPVVDLTRVRIRPLGRKERLRWVKACASDSDIHDYLIEKLTMSIERHRMEVREEERLLQVLKDATDAKAG